MGGEHALVLGYMQMGSQRYGFFPIEVLTLNGRGTCSSSWVYADGVAALWLLSN